MEEIYYKNLSLCRQHMMMTTECLGGGGEGEGRCYTMVKFSFLKIFSFDLYRFGRLNGEVVSVLVSHDEARWVEPGWRCPSHSQLKKWLPDLFWGRRRRRKKKKTAA